MKKVLEVWWIRVLTAILVAFAGTLLFIQLFSHTSFHYDSLFFKLRMNMAANGGTLVAVPPIGQLFYKTHQTPWQLVITLDEVDFTKLEKQLDSLPPKQLWLKTFQKETLKAVLTLFTMVVVWGLLGGLFSLLIFKIFPPSRLFWYGIISSVTLLFLFIGTTVITYDSHAVEHPQYRGLLAAAPWAMNLVTMSLDNIEVIGSNLKKISQGLPRLFKQAGEIKNVSELQSDLIVLHVTDIHNNPAAFDLIEELVSNFKVQFIIDTGDLTDYGTALEASIIQRIARIKIPYIFIPGNHDSPLILNRLARLKSVKLIIKKNLKIYGLTIVGEADPAAFNYSSDLVSAGEYEVAEENLMAKIERLTEPPDIVAVHNRLLTNKLVGKVPLIIHGHDHSYKLTTEKNTIIDDAGTTGAAGIRGLSNEDLPYSASILYWKENKQGKLKLHAVDSIKINGYDGSLTIDRRIF